jgi:hypothetical protein
MKAIVLITLILLFILISSYCFADEVYLLKVGQFFAEQVHYESGENWFGLFRSAKGDKLYQTKITVEKISTPFDEGDEPGGVTVTVDRIGHPIFLVKGSNCFRSGPINTLLHDNLFLYPAQDLSLSLEKRHYNLMAFGSTNDEGHILSYGLRLWDSKLRKYQTIAQINNPGWETTQNSFNILWAGDLDTDGRLDLFLNLSEHYAEKAYALFLSSFADEGSLLKKVATFEISHD